MNNSYPSCDQSPKKNQQSSNDHWVNLYIRRVPSLVMHDFIMGVMSQSLHVTLNDIKQYEHS